MIDFRYHLVSLVAVFLALAIGIVLGAGPLRENLGETLTEQVEQLRADRDEMRTQNSSLAAENIALQRVMDESSHSLVAHTLDGQRVSIVTDSSSLSAQTQAISSLIQRAGGQPGTTVTLNEAMWAPGSEQQRTEALDTIRKAWPGLSTTAGTSTESLSLVLSQVLSAHTELSPEGRTEILRVLSDNGIVSASNGTVRGADAVAFVSGADDELVSQGDTAEQATERLQRIANTRTSLITSLQTQDTPVTVGSVSTTADTSAGLVRLVRTGKLNSSVSSVDSLQSASGPLTLTLAIAESCVGQHGAYGVAGDATALLPDPDAIRAAMNEADADPSEAPKSTDSPASDGGEK